MIVFDRMILLKDFVKGLNKLGSATATVLLPDNGLNYVVYYSSNPHQIYVQILHQWYSSRFIRKFSNNVEFIAQRQNFQICWNRT